MPGFSASSPSRASAGGQEEQPWLVNSSTTALLPLAGGSSTPALPDAARASAAIPATAPAQMGRKRLMAPTMPDAARNFRKNCLKRGHNSVTAEPVFREICSERRQISVVNLPSFANREHSCELLRPNR